MKNIEVVEVKGEKVYLKKGWFSYRTVQPYQDENGKRNFIVLFFGGWGNFAMLLFILFIILSFFNGVREMTAGCRDMAENPCHYTNLNCNEANRHITNEELREREDLWVLFEESDDA